MAINALNTGAKVWLADLEDANTPHWHNVVGGQVNLTRRRAPDHLADDGRQDVCAAHRRRPRGHRRPPARLAPGRASTCWLTARRSSPPWSTSGCTSSTTPRSCCGAGAGRTSTCPRWRATSRPGSGTTCSPSPQDRLGIPHGTIRATVLIETITAAFEMDEILYELRDHASGLNAGRWDYLFSIIKNFRDPGPTFVLPDRASVTMTAPFMRAYTELLVRPATGAARSRSAGWPPSSPTGATRRSTSRRWPRCAPTRSARPPTASTARGSPTRTWCRSAGRSSTPCSATARTSSTGCART